MTYRKRRKTTSLLVGAAASIVAVGLAGPAGAAPTAQQSAQATIGMLQAQGFSPYQGLKCFRDNIIGLELG